MRLEEKLDWKGLNVFELLSEGTAVNFPLLKIVKYR
jgi:hypothetical protein